MKEKLIPIFKNSEGLETLPYFHPNMLVCQCFGDAGRKHDTPESETRDLVSTTVTHSSVLAFSLYS